MVFRIGPDAWKIYGDPAFELALCSFIPMKKKGVNLKSLLLERSFVFQSVIRWFSNGSHSSSLGSPLQALCLPTKFVARV